MRETEIEKMRCSRFPDSQNSRTTTQACNDAHNPSLGRMIYAYRAFFALVLLVAVNGLVRFPVQKRDNREFVANVASRAARGLK